ncbi:COG1801: Uncharacterized conserved protein [Richelia intracellularis]|nr:COG1801: Uncharacterized conserved protein [Richelia intracellularis]
MPLFFDSSTLHLTFIGKLFLINHLIYHPTLEMNQPFLLEWVNYIQQCLQQGKQIYFFVHCPVEERSPHTARHFYNLLHHTGIDIPPFPWNQIKQHPQQLSLWETLEGCYPTL